MKSFVHADMPLTREILQQPFWSLEGDEVFSILKSTQEGLTDAEVEARHTIFGTNSIPNENRLRRIRVFMRQFANPMVLILLGAALITLFFREWIEAVVIFAAVAANAALGFWQENKAESVLELLKSYIRTRARVRRGAKEREVDAELLVPGDVIHLQQGGRIPADARLIGVYNLEVDESILTGESLPSEKDPAALPITTALAERASVVFSGTLVVRGFADAVVTATGMATEFGKIASLVATSAEEHTPLERSLSKFVARSGAVLGLLVVMLFFLGIASGKGIFDMFLIAVAVAVSAVPEGLPVALTVILAVGVQRLAVRGGIVRKLLAAETLGSTTLILTDKTGTLTQAKMVLEAVHPYKGKGKDAEAEIVKLAVFNTDVLIENEEHAPEEWRILGQPIETALVREAGVRGIRLKEIFHGVTLYDRLPFSSAHKFSASLVSSNSGNRLVLLGAPEILMKYTTLSEEERRVLSLKISEMASRGARVIGVAYQELASLTKETKDLVHRLDFNNLEFGGLLSFRDPLRPGVREAITRIKTAGVNTIIVTGDHKGTAESVARELGIMAAEDTVITGEELSFLSRNELLARVKRVRVFARVSPEQKVLITQLYKSQGEIVAVTGDGINDAPSLKAADIGVAVGSGTDIAKNAADLVILDDDFKTIVAAIEEGRKIHDNIRKVIVYLLSDALDELLLIGGSLLTGLALPLNAFQILFVNFFSDSFPALSLAFEKGIDGLGSRPRMFHRALFDREMRFLILVIGTFSSAFLFGLYFVLTKSGFPLDIVKTFIYASFAIYTLFLAFSVRSLEKSIFEYNPFGNMYLVGGIAVGLSLTLVSIYVPFLREFFGTVYLPMPWLAAVGGIGVLNIFAVECGKALYRSQKC